MLYQWIISLPMMVCLFWCIFFVVRFFRGSDELSVKRSILLFYLASTVLYLNHWLYFSDAETAFGAYTYLLANLSVYPLYYVYLRALTRAHSSNKEKTEIGILFLPAVLMAFLFPLNARFAWIGQAHLLLAARFCFAVQVIWVWVRGFRLLRDTRTRLDSIYTDYRSHLLYPSHLLLILIGITAMASTLLNILGRDTFDDSLLVAIPAILMSVLLYSLGYVAAHTTMPAETVALDEPVADTATTAETDELFHKITTALREQQLFTNPHLTIQDLAAAIGSNRTYVSACINRRSNFSFSQLVAQYRVEYAKTILLDPQYTSDHEALSNAIALSGFASDQTFFRVFKDLTGLTPLQFRQQNLPK